MHSKRNQIFDTLTRIATRLPRLIGKKEKVGNRLSCARRIDKSMPRPFFPILTKVPEASARNNTYFECYFFPRTFFATTRRLQASHEREETLKGNTCPKKIVPNYFS